MFLSDIQELVTRQHRHASPALDIDAPCSKFQGLAVPGWRFVLTRSMLVSGHSPISWFQQRLASGCCRENLVATRLVNKTCRKA
jgi:hypothetical protein